MKRTFRTVLMALAVMSMAAFTACEKEENPVLGTPGGPGTDDSIPATPKLGFFSVSPDLKVVIAPGNLQYNCESKKWDFAPNPYDFAGTANLPDSNGQHSGWIDLYGWGTGDRPTFHGKSTDYANFVEWGTNIGTKWRTPTSAEWEYLLLKRPRHDTLCVPAILCGVNGIVLLPDDWDGPQVRAMYWNSKFEHNTYTAESWKRMEAYGAVFLPACGFINEDLDHKRWLEKGGEEGFYWSASANEESFAKCFNFTARAITMQGGRKYTNRAVRLVLDVTE